MDAGNELLAPGRAHGNPHDGFIPDKAPGAVALAGRNHHPAWPTSELPVYFWRANSRRYLKSVSGVSDVAIRAFELRRGQCYLKPCVRRSRRGVTHVTCANPLLAH